MSTWRFISRGANLESKGFLKDCLYHMSNRRVIPQEQTAFMYTVAGAGLAQPISLRETTVWREFTLVENDATNPVPTGSAATQTAPIQQPVQQPQQIAPPVATQPIPQVPQAPQAPQAPKVSAEQLLQAIQAVDKKFDHLSIASQPKGESEQVKDLLLSELLKLDFAFCNIKIIKSEKDASLCIVIDGMDPLSHTGKDITAEVIVKKITETFTEEAMLITSCREWKKSAKETAVKAEEEAKKAKTALESAQKAATAAPKAETAKVPAKGKTTADKKAEQETAVAQQAGMAQQQPLLIPDEPGELLDDEDLENEVAPEEFPIEESNLGGVSQEVSDFVL